MCRFAAACRFLIDTFGREILARGSGVLDIGGGRGDLSFELVNLNNIRATIVDPRPGSLSKQAKWLKVSPTSTGACSLYSTRLVRAPVAYNTVCKAPVHISPQGGSLQTLSSCKQMIII